MSDTNSSKAITPELQETQESAVVTTDAAARADVSRELIKAMAMDIGKSLVAYIEVMYPEAINATSSTFKLSMRNHVYNDIMSIVELHDEAAIRARLATNEAHRKQWVDCYRRMRRADAMKARAAAVPENAEAK